MTLKEAESICREFYQKSHPTEEECFVFTEAMGYIIQETDNPDAMLDLGGYYYERRDFDLALKYYEMAADRGSEQAAIGLGYIWYYGRTGKKDYEKAFRYYDQARRLGSLIGAYKVADMYKNGYAVPQDPAKYRAIIEKLYSKVKKARYLNDPLPEVFTRLAKIRTEDGQIQEALRLYDRARNFLAQRIQNHPFFGDLNIMKWLIADVYRLRPFDPELFGLYDLYYVLLHPAKVRFTLYDVPHEAEALEEDGAVVIRFDSRWFRTIDDFFQKAEIDGKPATALYDDMLDFEIISWTGNDREAP